MVEGIVVSQTSRLWRSLSQNFRAKWWYLPSLTRDVDRASYKLNIKLSWKTCDTKAESDRALRYADNCHAELDSGNGRLSSNSCNFEEGGNELSSGYFVLCAGDWVIEKYYWWKWDL